MMLGIALTRARPRALCVRLLARNNPRLFNDVVYAQLTRTQHNAPYVVIAAAKTIKQNYTNESEG